MKEGTDLRARVSANSRYLLACTRLCVYVTYTCTSPTHTLVQLRLRGGGGEGEGRETARARALCADASVSPPRDGRAFIHKTRREGLRRSHSGGGLECFSSLSLSFLLSRVPFSSVADLSLLLVVLVFAHAYIQSFLSLSVFVAPLIPPG